MPALDYDARLISDVHLEGSLGRWQVHVRYGERRHQLGTWPLYADAHKACSPSALEKALGSPEKRAKREVADGAFSAWHWHWSRSKRDGTARRRYITCW